MFQNLQAELRHLRNRRGIEAVVGVVRPELIEPRSPEHQTADFFGTEFFTFLRQRVARGPYKASVYEEFFPSVIEEVIGAEQNPGCAAHTCGCYRPGPSPPRTRPARAHDHVTEAVGEL